MSVTRTGGLVGMGSAGRVAIKGYKPAITCGPSQPIEGVVVDSRTKQPIPGVVVCDYKLGGFGIAAMRVLTATTDKDGRFRLIGFPKSNENVITAAPCTKNPNGLPYFQQNFQVPKSDNLKPVPMEISLQRGALIRGTDFQQANPGTISCKHSLQTLLGQSNGLQNGDLQ